MTIIVTISATDGAAGMPVCKCASIVGMNHIIAATPITPPTNQYHDRINNNARAQRRARIEPSPSQTNTTAAVPYIIAAGTKPR